MFFSFLHRLLNALYKAKVPAGFRDGSSIARNALPEPIVARELFC
jgi:hypothetical protein